jgi:hypothetical protein
MMQQNEDDIEGIYTHIDTLGISTVMAACKSMVHCGYLGGPLDMSDWLPPCAAAPFSSVPWSPFFAAMLVQALQSRSVLGAADHPS